MITEVTDKTLEDFLKTDKLVVIKHGAVWCPPCRMVDPVFEEIAKDEDERFVIGKVDVDNNPEISTKFGIRNIPAVVFIKNGEVVDRIIGASPKTEYLKKIEELCNKG